MRYLVLEASAAAASCALLENQKVLGEFFVNIPQTHSQTLLPMAQGLLDTCGVPAGAVDFFAVTHGPGSFTGLRIGMAAVKGLAWASDKPCVPVSTLEAMAWPLAHLEGVIVCAMDARRQQIYNAVFRAGDGVLTRLREDRAVSLEDAAADLAALGEPLTIVGDGAALCGDFFREKNIPCRLAPVHLRLQSAVGVGLAACRLWPDGAVDPQALAPVYLRLSQAERERLEREKAT